MPPLKKSISFLTVVLKQNLLSVKSMKNSSTLLIFKGLRSKILKKCPDYYPYSYTQVLKPFKILKKVVLVKRLTRKRLTNTSDENNVKIIEHFTVTQQAGTICSKSVSTLRENQSGLPDHCLSTIGQSHNHTDGRPPVHYYQLQFHRSRLGIRIGARHKIGFPCKETLFNQPCVTCMQSPLLLLVEEQIATLLVQH